jgi:hypothetical protein
VLTRHELTRRQADELAALITDVTSITFAPWAILAELRRVAGPVDEACPTTLPGRVAQWFHVHLDDSASDLPQGSTASSWQRSR